MKFTDISNEIYAILGIIYVMIVLPLTTITGKSLPFWCILVLYIIWMVYKKKQGYSMVLLAICMCQTSVTNEQIDSKYITKLFAYFYYALLFLPVLISLYLYKRDRIKPCKASILVSLMFVLIGLFYGLPLSKLVYIIITTHVAFYIGFCDSLKDKSLIRLYSIMVLISSIYAGMEYYLGVCPYTSLYLTDDNYLNYRLTKRAVGLLGNPLILLLIATFYQAIICSYSINNNKIPVFSQFLCLFLSLLVVSRTAVFSLAIFFLLYSIFTLSNLTIKKVLQYCLIVIVACYLINVYMGNALVDLIYRLENTDNLHRESSFIIALNILKDNLFGLGFHDYGNALHRYATFGKSANVNTLDNFFLTQIAHYGIWGLFIIYFYICYFISQLKFKKWYKTNKELLFLMCAFVITAFCFDFEAYNHVCFIIYVLIGSAFSRLQNTKLKKV